MSGDLLQEDNPFLEEQWKFVNAVADLLREKKETAIGSPLLEGVQYALEKHQIPQTKAQVNIDAAIEDIASLLFDGIYSCDFIREPVLLISGYTIDKAVFDALSTAGLLSDTIILSHPANALTKQLIQLFNGFLGAIKKDFGSAPLPPWLAEHFSDETSQTPLAAAKQLEQEVAVTLGGGKRPRSRASSIVLLTDAVSITRKKESEIEQKACIELGTLGLIEGLSQEMQMLTADLKKSSEKTRTENRSIDNEKESFKQKDLANEMISQNQLERLYRWLGWEGLFFLLAAVLILALSTFLPGFYQALILFLAGNPALATVLAAILIVFGVFVLFTAGHFFLTSLKTSPIPSTITLTQKKDQEKTVPQQPTLQGSAVKVPGPLSRAVLDLLDTRQKNIKKYTQLMAVIKSRPAGLEENQRRDCFLQRSIVGLKQQHFEEHDVARHAEAEQAIAREQRRAARIANLMRGVSQEMKKCQESAYKHLDLQQSSGDDEEESKRGENIYGDLRLQLVHSDEESEQEGEFGQDKAAYAALWVSGKDGDESEGSVVELDAQGTNVLLSDEEGESEEENDQALQLH